MSNFDIEKVIREYIPNVLHMSLGTCTNNRPWVCEVHFVYDDKLNLYWRSLETRRHSQDIARNPWVAGNIVEPHGPGQKPRGVYFEGRAEVLRNVNETHPVYSLFCQRLGTGPEILEDAKNGGHQFYKLTVSDYYVFDTRESAPSQKYHLPWSGQSNQK